MATLRITVVSGSNPPSGQPTLYFSSDPVVLTAGGPFVDVTVGWRDPDGSIQGSIRPLGAGQFIKPFWSGQPPAGLTANKVSDAVLRLQATAAVPPGDYSIQVEVV